VAPGSARLARAIGSGLAEEDARRRLRAQATDAERAEIADVVIVNDGPVERLVSSLERFWEEYAVGGGVR